MGSLPPSDLNDSKEWNVLVTGFGPFSDNPLNPSFLIAKSLPRKVTSSKKTHINVHPYPNSIDVRYKTVLELIPKLLFENSAHACSPPVECQSRPSPQIVASQAKSKAQYDLILHIGVASPRKYYALEELAHRDSYTLPDVDGESLENDTFWRDQYHSPEILRPSFDIWDVWRRWKSELVDEDIEVSDDAGHYLCDFIYYASMLEYWRRNPNGRRPCMFLHVPGGVEEEDLERGRRVAVGLITALVESEIAQRKKKQEDAEDHETQGKRDAVVR